MSRFYFLASAKVASFNKSFFFFFFFSQGGNALDPRFDPPLFLVIS